MSAAQPGTAAARPRASVAYRTSAETASASTVRRGPTADCQAVGRTIVQPVKREVQPFDRARVRMLLKPLADYDGWRVNQRPPRLGDVGVVLEVLPSPEGPEAYVVECVDANGGTVFLGDFLADEIEAIDAVSPAPSGED